MTVLKFTRMGDFLECIGDGAPIAAKALGVAVTTRNGVPMCGIPVWNSGPMLRDLNSAGYDVETDAVGFRD